MATQGMALWSKTAASNANSDPAGPFPEGMAPSAVNDGVRGLMASAAKWRDDIYGLTTGGTSTAFTVTTNATYASASDMSGAIFTIVPNATSGAAPTLAVDGLTARALNISTGVAIPTGALVSGTPYLVKYVHATTEFIVLGVIGKSLLSALDIVGGTAAAIAVDDTLPFYDLSATANRNITISEFLKVTGLLTVDSTPDSAADYAMTYDASFGGVKRVLLDNWPKGAQPPAGAFKNLVIKVTGNTGLTVAADFVTTTDGTLFKTTAVSSTVNLGTTGANALDAGTIAAGTWYFIWVVVKTDNTTACIASTSATSPTLPSGYTYKARVGAVQTLPGAATLYGTWQFGRVAQYVVGLAGTTINPNIANGAAGTFSYTSPTLAAVTVAGNGKWVPTTASRIHVVAYTHWKGGTLSDVLLAPSTAWGGTNNGPHGSNGILYPYFGDSAQNVPGSVWLLLESTAIAWASNQAGAAISCLGWEDAI